MSKLSLWIEAARPRTLGAGIVPVLVGTAAAQRFIALRFWGALLVAIALQVGVNFANDYFDGVKGVDTGERAGPRRLTASGLIAARSMRMAFVIAFSVAALAGAGLAAVADWWLLVPGALALAAAVFYSGSSRPYGSRGLGELFVFVFFGLVATAGSAFVQDEVISGLAIAAAVPAGLLATGILMANNLRDIETDEAAGKDTLAVRVGPGRARRIYRLSITCSYFALPVIAELGGGVLAWLPIFSIPAAVAALNAVADEDPGLLGAAARLHVIFGIHLAGGLWIG